MIRFERNKSAVGKVPGSSKIELMRVLLAIMAGLWFIAAPVWAQAPNPAPPGPSLRAETPATQPCTGKSARECGVSKQDFSKAHDAFARGQKLKTRDGDQALAAFDEAVRLVPRNVEYLTAREALRQQLVYDHLRLGNELVAQNRTVEGTAEFRRALELDPGNSFAAQRLRDAANAQLPPLPTFIEPAPDEGATVLQPKAGQQTFRISGDTRSAYTQIGAAFGIKITFDDSTPSRSVRLELNQISFRQAADAIALITRSFWTPISSNEILVAADTQAKHKELDRWLLRTFYLPETSAPQELNDIVNLLRTLFEIRFITQAPASATITVRGPAPVIEAATQFLQTLWAGRPQVMLDLEAYEVSRQMLQTIGLDLPLQFNIFNIPQAALAALSNNTIQQLINQISAGGINGANASNLSALLAQLQQQQNSLFQNPVATFGGGTTLMGIAVPPATANFSKNDSRVLSLEKLSMRASQGNAATFRLGTRYPVLNASYSPFFNTPLQNAVSSLNPSSLATFPSFTYEDLGITLKAKPIIRGTSEVTLDLELEIKSLGGQALNGIPILNSRSYKGVITVPNDEPAVVAGTLSRSEQLSLRGIPGLSRIPVLSNRHTETDEDELLLLITPHILSAAPQGSTPAVVLPRGQ